MGKGISIDFASGMLSVQGGIQMISTAGWANKVYSNLLNFRIKKLILQMDFM